MSAESERRKKDSLHNGKVGKRESANISLPLCEKNFAKIFALADDRYATAMTDGLDSFLVRWRYCKIRLFFTHRRFFLHFFAFLLLGVPTRFPYLSDSLSNATARARRRLTCKKKKLASSSLDEIRHFLARCAKYVNAIPRWKIGSNLYHLHNSHKEHSPSFITARHFSPLEKPLRSSSKRIPSSGSESTRIRESHETDYRGSERRKRRRTEEEEGETEERKT